MSNNHFIIVAKWEKIAQKNSDCSIFFKIYMFLNLRLYETEFL
jgi:hypothetical protein